MHYDTKLGHGLPHDPLKALVAPRPIGWISAMSAAGKHNLSPYSFFNMVSESPDMVMFSSSGRKDALTYIEETGEFTCSVASWPQREAVVASSATLPRGQSEFEYVGLNMASSHYVRPPRVAGAPGAIECRHVKTIPMIAKNGEQSHYMVIGEVVGVYIADEMIENGLVNSLKLQTIMRGGYLEYFVADNRFSVERPSATPV